MRRRASIFVLLLLALAPRLSRAADAIEPDPTVQSQITVVAAAKNDSELEAALGGLRQSNDPQYTKLIPQLVYTLMNTRDDRTAMAVGIVIKRLAISPEQIRAALQPYQSTKDPRLKRQIDNLVGAGN